jgi:hypothetical protein
VKEVCVAFFSQPLKLFHELKLIGKLGHDADVHQLFTGRYQQRKHYITTSRRMGPQIHQTAGLAIA